MPMAEQLVTQLKTSNVKISGLVITKTGHDDGSLKSSGIQVREASHPVPCQDGVTATKELIQHAHDHIDNDTCVFVLLTGGGSSLLVAPADGLSLSDLQDTSSLLLSCGADIGEMNCVRRALSAVKGGRLLKHLAPAARVYTLALSDVVGDDLGTIASGPTVPSPTTPADAEAVLEKYALASKVAPAVRQVLQGARDCSGGTAAAGAADSQDAHQLDHFSAHVIGSNEVALRAAASAAAAAGFTPHVLSSTLEGGAAQVAADLVLLSQAVCASDEATAPSQELLTTALGRLGCSWATAADLPGLSTPLALIFGGETTVDLSTADGAAPGMGGRNQELALAAAVAFAEGPLAGSTSSHFGQAEPQATLLAVGTDGTDGPTDAAGGLVTCCTLTGAGDSLLAAKASLAAHDAYHALDKVGALLKTGPTGTNVMDVTIVFLLPA